VADVTISFCSVRIEGLKMDKRKILVLRSDTVSENVATERWTDYAYSIQQVLQTKGHDVRVLALPSEKQQLISSGQISYWCVIAFTHGRNRKENPEPECGPECMLADPLELLCACLSHDGRIGALKASEAVNIPVFRQARMLGATCCYGARHFADTLFKDGGLAFFIGYEHAYLWADVQMLFGVDQRADPFWRAAQAGCLSLVDGADRAEILLDMIDAYSHTYRALYRDSRLDYLSRITLYFCLVQTIRALKSVPYP
jgi:hypothetical protein